MSKTRTRALIVLIGLALLALIALTVLWHQARSRNRLEEYVAQLRAGGEKLSVVEVLPFRTNIFRNTESLIAAQTARLSSARQSPSRLELRHYSAPGRALAAWKSDAAWHPNPRDETAEDWACFFVAVDRLAGPLAALRQALEDPDLDLGPRVSLMSRPVNHFVALRTAAVWLAGAMLAELRRGDHEAALENLEALASLARLDCEEPLLVSQMIRIAIGGLGTAAVWEALQAPDWTEPQLARMQAAFERLDLVQALETGLQGERVMGRECWDSARHSNSRQTRRSFGLVPGAPGAQITADALLLPAYRLIAVDDDELRYLQLMQEALVAIRSLKQDRPWVEINRPLVERMERFKSAPALERFRYWLSYLATPNFVRALQTGVRREVERRLAVTAIALRRYTLRYGRPPPNLAALTPDFLRRVPVDLMDGQPLRYRLLPDGTWRLYSVGEDGRDNGGDPTCAPRKNPELWEGRDAVWPTESPW